MLGIVEALKKCDIELGKIEGNNKNEKPLINAITDVVAYFEKNRINVINQKLAGNKASWFDLFCIGVVLFTKGKVSNKLPENFRSMIVNGLMENKGGLRHNGTLYEFSEDKSDISFRKIADTLFGKDFSDFFTELKRLPSISIVSLRLKQYAVKINTGESVDIGDVLGKLFSEFLEVEKNNKGMFNNLIKD